MRVLLPPSPVIRTLLCLSLTLACQAAPDRRETADEAATIGVALLLVDGVYNTELTAPMDMFHHAEFHRGEEAPAMRVFTVAPTTDVVTTFEGLRILPDYSFATAPRVDVLVVPSAEHSMDEDLENAALVGWVRRVGGQATWILSLCDGAFVLAAAGLLDGHACTTFPSDRDRLRERFPQLEVLDVSFVHDGNRITSVGGAPSFEPALYLCELLYGEAAARGIAAGLVIDWDKDRIDHVVR